MGDSVIIGVTGYKRSGKNTVADVLAIDYDFTLLSFAEPVYQMVFALNAFITPGARRVQSLVEEFGWDLAKETFPEVRRQLQAMGTECGRDLLGASIWIDTWEKSLPAESNRRIVVPDVRFPNEAERIRGLGGLIWRVTRPGTAPDGHRSEVDLDRIVPDAVLTNTGSIEDLHTLARQQMETIELAV